jgi:hypothetical protein
MRWASRVVLPTTSLKNCTHSFLLPNRVCQAIDSSATTIADRITAAGTTSIRKIAFVVLFINILLQNDLFGFNSISWSLKSDLSSIACILVEYDMLVLTESKWMYCTYLINMKHA